VEILVVVKESNYEIHGPRVERFVHSGRLDAAILNRLLNAHQQHYRTVEAVKSALQAHGLDYALISRREQWPTDRQFSVILTVGGDGTVLFSAQNIPTGKPRVVGIRSTDDSVGYLCAYDFGQERQMVEAIASERLVCEPVQRMKAEVRFADERPPVETLPVLNDLLFSNINPALTTRYRLRFGRYSEVQRSSGIWISTAIGSTAAIQAAGGSVQNYNSILMQFRPRELFRPPNHFAELDGALFDPDFDRLVIENYCESAVLALDGQHGSVSLGYGDSIEVKRASPLNLAISQRIRERTV
jgi:NAD+ kinase